VTWYQEWFGEEYLELYSYRDESEARLQAAFFHQQCGMPADRRPVLDLACGMGRHVQELKALGYRVAGCDLSYILLRTGMREYGPMPVARADMRHLPFCDAVFGGLVNFFTSFGYFATEDENLQVVREMARVLAPARRFCSTTSTCIASWKARAARDARHADRDACASSAGSIRSDRSFNKRITIGEKRYLERVRGYDLDEISAMFASCNLRSAPPSATSTARVRPRLPAPDPGREPTR
jgi:SAM-dependent methyltransferase